MKNKFFVVGAVSAAIVIFSILSLSNRLNKRNDSGEESMVQTTDLQSEGDAGGDYFVRPHSPRFGNAAAEVTVVEWLDPECEACREMHPVTKALIREYQDRVLFVVRYMPFHGSSDYAASLLEEAREFGKYQEALDIVYENQPEWGNHMRPKPELLAGYFKKIGIPEDNLDREKLMAKHSAKLNQDRDDGEKAGVSGTPTFFINKKKLQDLGEGPLRAAIEAELARK